MSVPSDHRLIGPRQGSLILYTSREGVAAHVGHDLTIEMTNWSGRLRVGPDPAASELIVTVDMGSMHIVEGIGGLAALSDGEKREILRNARKILLVDRYPEATFVADKITGNAVHGTLSLLGRSHPLQLAYRIDGGRHRVRGTILQSDYGIKPFRAFFGALKLADAVRIEAELNFS
jgi:polyisoprenoid-binding protein YceI